MGLLSMTDINEQIEVECENIERVLSELYVVGSLDKLSRLELAGAGSLLHNFYNGIENILKQIITAQEVELPCGPSWHRELIDTANSSKIISTTTANDLKRYLAFRHFFSHGYSIDLRLNLIKPLIEDAEKVFMAFRNDILKIK